MDSFEFWFGGIFAFVGTLIACIMIPAGLGNGMLFMALIGLVMGACFGGVGYYMIYLGIKMRKKRKNAFALGKKIHGVIIDYEDDNSVRINGVPLLVVIVRAEIEGKFRDFGVNTHQIKEDVYPRGAECDIFLYENELFIKPESVVTSVSANALYRQYMQEESINNIPVKPGLNQHFLDQEREQPIFNRFAAEKYKAEKDPEAKSGEYEPSAGEYGNRIPGVTYLNGKPIDKNGRPL
ncbi:MAG: hypothetical protein J6M24_00555 [Lachnospiraceae bacterium]|nr:hypothetical protein [Lachnospiraceae bacterium]